MKFLVILILVLVFITGCQTTEPVACTEDARLCPDGTSVVREGPDCEFAECPEVNDTNGTHGCEPYTKQCPDGTWIGPSGPDCEMPECPDSEWMDCPEELRGAEACTLDWRPICGLKSDGSKETYGNVCGGCSQLDVLGYVEGECEPEKTFCTDPDSEACTREYRPVCGWNGPEIQCIKYPCASTYSNPCTACADEIVEYWTEGECPEE